MPVTGTVITGGGDALTAAEYTECYQDLIEYLQAHSQAGGTAGGQADFRLICQNALRELTRVHEWDHYVGEYRLHFNNPYSTGTLTYDHVDSTYPREVTFSDAMSAAVQAWAPYARLRISDRVYAIDEVKDSTTVTLREENAPDADIAAGTSFTMYRSEYLLPVDFWKAHSIYLDDEEWALRYVSPSQWQWNELFVNETSMPVSWTLLKSPKHHTRWMMCVEPYPGADDESLALMYRRGPRRIKYTGTVATDKVAGITATAGESSATIAGLKGDVVGSVVRFSADTSSYPTGLYGVNPYYEQLTIKTYNTGTGATTFTSALDASYAATKVVVTDPIDVSDNMLHALHALLEAYMARHHSKRSADVATADALARRAIRVAMENEVRMDRSSWYRLDNNEEYFDVTWT